jgi:hypothetical protein
MFRRWDRSKPPRGEFAVNRDCPQALGLFAWFPSPRPGGKLVERITSKDDPPTWTGTEAYAANDYGAHSYSFNGSSYATYGTDYLLPAVFPISLHAFAKSTAIANPQGICVTGSNGQLHEAGCLIFVSSQLWALSQGTIANRQATSGTLSSNVWYGCGGIFRAQSGAGAREVYVNGASAGTDTNDCGSVSTAQDSVRIGSRFNTTTQYMSGIVSDVCLWTIDVGAAVMARMNDPSLRYELYYPLRSRKWFSAAAAGTVPMGAYAQASRHFIGVGVN